MILSDHSIRSHLSGGNLVDKPDLIDDEQIQPASLDVRLGDQFAAPSNGDEWRADEIVLKPGARLLGHTEEVVDLPNDIAAQLAGRSTIGRRGIIVHKTAGWIDPGFKGQITLELANMGMEKQRLYAGERIAQLVFLQLDQPSSGYDGKYQGDTGPVAPKED
jgi:dCTP deaminase